MGGRGELVGGDRVALVVNAHHDGAADGGSVAGQALAEERSVLEAVVGAHGVGPEGELGEGGTAAGLPAAAPGGGENGDAVAVGIQGLGCDFAAGLDDLAALGHPALEGVADVSEAVLLVAGEGLVAVGVEVVDRDVLAAVDLELLSLDDGGHLAVQSALGLGLNDVVNNRQRVLVLLGFLDGLFGGLFDGLFDDLFGGLFSGLFDDLFGGLFDDLFDGLFDDLFDGLFDGLFDDLFDGLFDGLLDGLLDGLFDDLFDDLFDSLFDYLLDGLFDGLLDGLFDDHFDDLFFILGISIDASGGESDGKEHGQDQDHGQCTSHFLHRSFHLSFLFIGLSPSRAASFSLCTLIIASVQSREASINRQTARIFPNFY